MQALWILRIPIRYNFFLVFFTIVHCPLFYSRVLYTHVLLYAAHRKFKTFTPSTTSTDVFYDFQKSYQLSAAAALRSTDYSPTPATGAVIWVLYTGIQVTVECATPQGTGFYMHLYNLVGISFLTVLFIWHSSSSLLYKSLLYVRDYSDVSFFNDAAVSIIYIM